jgi:hypothetical protein
MQFKASVQWYSNLFFTKRGSLFKSTGLFSSGSSAISGLIPSYRGHLGGGLKEGSEVF